VLSILREYSGINLGATHKGSGFRQSLPPSSGSFNRCLNP